MLARQQQGFTLIELMIVVMIVAIFAAIAIPSYQAYARRTIAAKTQQEMQRLAEQLERWKGKNFSYLNFDPSYLYKNSAGTVVGYNATTATLSLPLGATGTAVQYEIFIKDGNDSSKTLKDGLGQRWAIKAESKDPKNYTFLLTSTGEQCRNTTTANVSYTDCGVGAEKKW